MKFKKTLAIIVSLAIVSLFSFSGCGSSDSGADSSSEPVAEKVEKDPDGTLMSFALTMGIQDDGTINYTEYSENAVCKLWDPEAEEFTSAELSDEVLAGNYVRLIDEDGDKKADLIQIVDREDGSAYWDPDLAWAKDAATKCEPSVDDATGLEVYGDESTLPYGERLLSGFGISDWSGACDFENSKKITYYSDIDFYNAKSGKTLTILPQYKTYLQPSGWSCGCCSALTVLDWYGLRGDLNDVDLSMLRGTETMEMGTETQYAKNIFTNLTELGITGEWDITTSDDDPEKLFDSEWVQNELKQGHPIMVEWNSFGWHWQTIIGYDNMGTEDTLDDVLIMMDSYDTTDQDNDGYYIESYERLAYGTCTPAEGEAVGTRYLVAVPSDWDYDMEKGDGIKADKKNKGVFTDKNKMGYGKTAEDIAEYYPDTPYLGENGLAGAATQGYERSGDHDNSAYYKFMDFYNLEDSETLHVLTNFETCQQSTEWTCGPTSALMTMNWFGLAEDETDVSLATHRQNDTTEGTYLDGMKDIFTYMNDEYDQNWVWVSTEDLDDPDGEESYIGDYCLQAGTAEGWYGLIPYLLDNDIPVMIGSDEWGGHWQVIIGYDDMGTVDKTEDDVLIIADPYDTTDHNQDGYLIDGFERLVYGWYSSFEPELKHNDFIAAFPADKYEKVVKALGADTE